MAYKTTSRSWIKLWVNEWLDGTTRYQMTDAQRAFWIDLLAMAGRSRYPGIVAAGKDDNSWVGYPLSVYQSMATSIDIKKTLALFVDTNKISLEETEGAGGRPLFKITIINWRKYQSEYLRQKAYRRQGTSKVTPKNTQRLPVEEEKKESRGREDKKNLPAQKSGGKKKRSNTPEDGRECGEIRGEIQRLYRKHNDDLPPPWNGRHGVLLARLLKENPSWMVERWLTCIRNRFLSEDVNVAEDPIQWLRKLPNYCRGPLDRFGKLNPVQKSPLEQALEEQQRREKA